MANVNASGPKFTIKSADTFFVGNASETFVSTFAIQLVASGWTGNIVVKARAQGDVANTDSVTPVAIPYIARNLNGVVGTDAVVSTTITTSSLILVPASGQEIVLDCTSTSGGTMTVYCYPFEGAVG